MEIQGEVVERPTSNAELIAKAALPPKAQKRELLFAALCQETNILIGMSRSIRITPELLESPKRDQYIFRPRSVCAYLLGVDCQLSSARIGAIMGGRDHSTISTSQQMVRENLAVNPLLVEFVNRVRARLETLCHPVVQVVGDDSPPQEKPAPIHWDRVFGDDWRTVR